MLPFFMYSSLCDRLLGPSAAPIPVRAVAPLPMEMKMVLVNDRGPSVWCRAVNVEMIGDQCINLTYNPFNLDYFITHACINHVMFIYFYVMHAK